MRFKRKKNQRARGTWTHGWGAKKKHRGSGNKGGKGHAGSGKRADSKNQMFLKIPDYFGKHGFLIRGKKPLIAVNIQYIEENIKWLVDNKKAVKEDEYYTLNLKDLGYDKLLSSGKPKNKYKITALCASEKAIEKIASAGGLVICTKAKENAPAKEKGE